MKVAELFEANEKGLQGGATYSPRFKPSKTDDSLGAIRGSVKDWLDSMNITPKDLEEALKIIKASDLFKNKFPAAGLQYNSRPAGEKRGTLSFMVDRTYPTGFKTKTGYNVYANGQIRSTSTSPYSDGGEHMTPLRAPKPRMKAGDPVGSIVMIMTAAMEEVLVKWKKAAAKMEKYK